MCVDDVGMHAGIIDAARRLIEGQRVHAVSCMVGARGWRAAASQLRSLAPTGIDIGLHLDLTEAPLRAGSRHGLGGLIVATQLRVLPRATLRAEIRAQLDAFEDALGSGPTHVDGHQHVHQFALVRTELLSELVRRYGDAPPWLRSTAVGSVDRSSPRASWRAGAKQRVIQGLGARALLRLAQRAGFRHNRALLGVYDFADQTTSYAERMRGWLAGARTGDLLMCHPSLAGPADAMGRARVTEFALLGSPLFGCMLRDAGVELAPMSRILRGAG